MSITFELGNFTMDSSMNVAPTFEADVTEIVQADVLLQFNWFRDTDGKWDNVFLFQTDAVDILNDISANGDANKDMWDVKYHTVGDNWCTRDITKENIDGYAIPQNTGVTHLTGFTTTTDISSANAKTYILGPSGAADETTGITDNAVGPLSSMFSKSTEAGTVGGYFNEPSTTKIKSYDDANVTIGDNNGDYSREMNLAGEFLRYFSFKLFGNKLNAGTDIFSNESEMLNKVRNLWAVDVSGKTQAQIAASNTVAPTGADASGNNYSVAQTKDNLAHAMFTGLIWRTGNAAGDGEQDPSSGPATAGIERLKQTLSKPVMENNLQGGGEEFVPTGVNSVTANLFKTDVSMSDMSGNEVAVARLHDVIPSSTTGGGQSISGLDTWYRLPLKEGDKIRIRLTVNQGTAAAADGFNNVVPARTYCIEYVLRNGKASYDTPASHLTSRVANQS